MRMEVEKVFLEKRTDNLSLAVLPIDNLSGGKPSGWIELRLKGSLYEPMLSGGGYYFFCNLPAGGYTVVITSEYYLDWEKDVVLPVPSIENPLIYGGLIPSGNYGFPVNATLLRGVVTDSGGNGLKDVEIEAAAINPLDMVKAKVSSGGAVAGDEEITLMEIKGVICPGDILNLHDKYGHTEVCRVMCKLGHKDEASRFRLYEKLGNTYPAGAVASPVYSTCTDERGQFVVVVRDMQKNDLEMDIISSHKELGVKKIALIAVEGKTVKTGMEI